MIGNISSVAGTAQQKAQAEPPAIRTNQPESDAQLKQAFYDFVGQTFYGHLMAAMRKTVPKSTYFHGGRAEEVFQNQLDQVFAENMARASAHTFAEPMYQLFMLGRS